MCGVAGIYSYHPDAPPVDRQELGKIRDYMSARGPDGMGEWCSDNGRVGIGHRRLAIIDLTERGAQPMISADGNLIISFNGEIYNYKLLRKRLEARGHTFKSDSDTEVILHLYADHGITMVNELRGMFAFILWDVKKNGMYLVRDPYGIKPLYYATDGKTVRVASQVKALVAGGNILKEKDPAGIVGFFLFGSVPEPYTIYNSIKSVPAGSTIWIDQHGVSGPKQYFSIAQTWKDAEECNVIKQGNIREIVREALIDSVQHHMVSDVSVGAFLSAGIDSGTLVGLMAELDQASITRTITLAFDEFNNRQEDESILAAQTASKYGTQHTTRKLTENEFHEDLPNIIRAMDQPSIDGINTWFVSKAAKELGIKVVISGLGGDELCGGYPSFRDIPRSVRYFGLPSKIPCLGEITRRLATATLTPLNLVSPKIFGLVKYGGNYPGAYFLRRGLFMPWELNNFLDSDFVRAGMEKLQPLQHIASNLEPEPVSDFAKVSILESSLYMRNQLLRDADWAGMAHSLEIRVPLVDVQLLSGLAPFLNTVTANNRKSYFAYSPAIPLPEKIISRRKTGFTTPISEWLASSDLHQGQNNRILKKSSVHWSRQWAEIIHNQFINTI